MRDEVFQSGEIGDLHIRSENPRPCGRFVRNRKSFLEGILLYLLMAPTEIPRQYFTVLEDHASSQGHNDPALHFDPS